MALNLSILLLSDFENDDRGETIAPRRENSPSNLYHARVVDITKTPHAVL